MSCGSYDYTYLRINNLSIDIEDYGIEERKKFKALLRLVAEAAHDIEWVDSGDYGFGDEISAIEKCFKFCKEN